MVLTGGKGIYCRVKDDPQRHLKSHKCARPNLGHDDQRRSDLMSAMSVHMVFRLDGLIHVTIERVPFLGCRPSSRPSNGRGET